MKRPVQLKVAIAHDWLVGGGAELVVLELHKLYPEAPIYTSYCTAEWQAKLDNKVFTGFLQRWPFGALRKYVGLLRIWWFSHLDFSGYDLVISSSGNGEAKCIKVPLGTMHVCYCHSPTHFYWRHYEQYLKHPGFEPFASFGLRLLVRPLRKWDKRVAQRPNYFIANSSHIQADIKEYYGRDSVVIYPPVDVERFAKAEATKRHGFITVGRQVPYKKVDIIVAACTKLKLPLTVVGWGPEHLKLKEMAGANVRFLDNASDTDVVRLMKSAEAFILAAFEDFGITPVEALAAGTPVIAYRAGGALDYVQDGQNGLFFDKQTTKSLGRALQEFLKKSFDHEAIKASAEQFSAAKFRNQIKDFVSKI